MLIKPQAGQAARIKVVGIGGGGGNALATMIAQEDIVGVEFIVEMLNKIELKPNLYQDKRFNCKRIKNTSRIVGNCSLWSMFCNFLVKIDFKHNK